MAARQILADDYIKSEYGIGHKTGRVSSGLIVTVFHRFIDLQQPQSLLMEFAYIPRPDPCQTKEAEKAALPMQTDCTATGQPRQPQGRLLILSIFSMERFPSLHKGP